MEETEIIVSLTWEDRREPSIKNDSAMNETHLFGNLGLARWKGGLLNHSLADVFCPSKPPGGQALSHRLAAWVDTPNAKPLITAHASQV